jgi:hypothetical protein
MEVSYLFCPPILEVFAETFSDGIKFDANTKTVHNIKVEMDFNLFMFHPSFYLL